MTEREAYFALNLIPHIGPVRIRRLVEHCGSAAAVLTASCNELEGLNGISRELATQIIQWETQTYPQKEWDRAQYLGIQILTLADEDYPPLLREIYDPPAVLYLQGQLPRPWPQGMAVVGSRQTTYYGLEMTKKLSYQLAYAGLAIVSGLARGIDTAAHQGALAAQGTTWAVLGCGLAKIYPPENRALAQKIIETQGCLLSELPLNTSPDRRTFPMRNRIVSGLSFGVLVTEAGLKSGALITARQALEQGRHVFAIPGRIDHPHAQGCHQLIKEGATLVESVEDVLTSLEFLPFHHEIKERPLTREMNENEHRIFTSIEWEETPIDHIIQKSGLPSGQVSSTLLHLEMKKFVRRLPGKRFVRTA